MKFFQRLEKLKDQYKYDCIIRKNDTLLLGPGKIPVCRHMLFKPLTEELINEYIRDYYKYHFPDEYAEFLKYSNGANLCYVKLIKPKFSYAQLLFTIYGLPRTPPYSRGKDMEEPYDLRFLDMDSNKNGLPETWLKCAQFVKDYNFSSPCSIFIDTASTKVYACDVNNLIINSWDTLDQCFCDILDSFADMKFIHDFTGEPN